MRGYIKEYPSEFGHSGEEVCEVEEKAPTEAEKYAAEAKRKRHEDDLGYIQGGIDKVSSGLASIGSGLAAVIRALSDMASSGTITKEVVFSLIIGILVISNIYTYVAFSSTSPARVARRQERENDLSEAVRLLLAQSSSIHTRDAQALVQILDNVEERVVQLRSAISATAPH